MKLGCGYWLDCVDAIGSRAVGLDFERILAKGDCIDAGSDPISLIPLAVPQTRSSRRVGKLMADNDNDDDDDDDDDDGVRVAVRSKNRLNAMWSESNAWSRRGSGVSKTLPTRMRNEQDSQDLNSVW
jgi:hypothetical protein